LGWGWGKYIDFDIGGGRWGEGGYTPVQNL